MTPDNSKQPPVESDKDDREDQPTIVHETIPGDAPIVTDGGASAKKKGSTSTSDEDI